MAGLRRRRLWVLGGGVATALVLVLLYRAQGPSPLPVGPGGTQSNPVALGTRAWAVVLYLDPRPGDRIELLSAGAVGLAAEDRPTLYLSRPVVEVDGTRTIGEELEPLAGAVIEVPTGSSPGPHNTVGIVAEITPEQPGTYELTGIVFQYRMNGEGQAGEQSVSVDWTVCADDPAPASCEEPEPDP